VGEEEVEMNKRRKLKIAPTIRAKIMDAFESYQHGLPVVILDEEGAVLHGEEILRQIVEYRVPLLCRKLVGVSRDLFEAGDAPAFLEAARQVYWEQRRPKHSG
jgi:hypothetical protein